MRCCLQALEVRAADGTTIGSIKEQRSCFSVIFHICDEDDNVILELRRDKCCIFGSICGTCGGENAEFDVITSNDEHIGKVTKESSKYAKGNYTYIDNFGIEFPIDLNVKCKAVILASLFLIVKF